MAIVRYPKPGLAPGFFLVVLLVGCGGAGETPSDDAIAAGISVRLSVPGTIENGNIDEASGLACSARKPGLLWVHNDSGAKARVYAIDDTGRNLGRIRLEQADNDDWEDIASFRFEDKPYLLVADTGDNDADRDDTRLYIIAEPDLAEDDRPELMASWTIDFSYEDGPRDTEAVAVDIDGHRALLLTKRDIPSRLYEVRIIPQTDAPVVARFLGTVDTLPRPSARDIEFAPRTDNWHWQPTAMDIAPDGSALAVLTYGAVYYYSRMPGEDWFAALSRSPLRLGIEDIRDAEALAFCAGEPSIFVTAEKKHAPLVRIDLEGTPDP